VPIISGGGGGGAPFNGGTITGALEIDNSLDVLPVGGGELFIGASGYIVSIPLNTVLDIEDHLGSSLVSVDEATRALVFGLANAAPADGLFSSGSFALWLDPTPGATKLMVKASDGNGVIKTAAISLS
jgi:hypothetical protein